MTKNEFIKKLRLNFNSNENEWENKTIPEYLEAIERYAEDVQGFYDNTNQNIDSEIASWKVFSDILIGASTYE